MWKDYSKSYLKINKASSISIIVAAFIATLFLSLLCNLFYNFWLYDIEQIVLEEGNWEARIIGPLEKEDILLAQNFANVQSVSVNQALSEGAKIAIEITFQNPRTIYEDVPLLLAQLDLPPEAVVYHEFLLSRYLIHDPEDEEPPLLLAFYLIVLLIVSFSLVLIIHNSFAVSMNARIHQFGIFSSIGATPHQIRICLLQEAAVLCTFPLLLGCATGTALSAFMVKAVNVFAADVAGRHEAIFHSNALIFIFSIALATFTVLLSAWLPAKRLSQLTPLEAIRNTSGIQLKKKRHSYLLTFLFGTEGQLAGNALKAQKKALRTSTLSLTLSFLGFTTMLCFLTLSSISTDHTYFERYQNAWDVMVTVSDQAIEEFTMTEQLQNLQGVQNCIVYQKAQAVVALPTASISDDVNALGGLEAVAGISATDEGLYFVSAPIVILDNDSFLDYCEQIGANKSLQGSIVLNQIWNSVNSNFRYKEYIPYIRENQFEIPLQNSIQEEPSIQLAVLAYTQQAPILREEYDNYSLVQFISLFQWKEIADQINDKENVFYIRVLAEGERTLAQLNELEAKVLQIVGKKYAAQSENRIQERLSNDNMIHGYMLIIGGFCALLAIIGISNVFSNTLGFLRQRLREFAQYMSIGMTPAQMKKMFCIEALVIAGRPLLITLPLTIASVGFMITASHLNPLEFLVRIPIVPIAGFIAAIFTFVAIAYYVGGKRMLKTSLISALRNNLTE